VLDQPADAGDRGGPEYQVHLGRAVQDLPLPELGHAAHHADQDLGPLLLQQTKLPQARENLVLRLLADRARVEQDEVGVLGDLRELVPLTLEQTRDPLGVVLVHLAAVGDQVEFWHKRSALTLASALGRVKPRRSRQALSSNTPILRNFS